MVVDDQTNQFIKSEFQFSQEDQAKVDVFERNTDLNEEVMEGDICGDINIDIKEEPLCNNIACEIIENPKQNCMQVKQNNCDIKMEKDVPFCHIESVFSIPNNVETRQSSDADIIRDRRLRDVFDTAVLSGHKSNTNVEDIVIERGEKFTKLLVDECVAKEFVGANAKLNESLDNHEQSFFDSLENYNVTFLHIEGDSRNDEESLEVDVERKCIIKHPELIITEVKTESGDNLDGGTMSIKKAYRKLLGTSEQLRVFLKREDLLELQKTFKNELTLRFQGPSKSSKRFSCNSCPFTAFHKFDLLTHISKNHKELAIAMKILPLQNMFPGEGPNQIWYRCTECVYISNQKNRLERHLSSPYLRGHKKLHEMKKTYRCASCPYETRVKEQLVNHVEKHRDELEIILHKCPFCSAAFRSKPYFKKHVKFVHKAEGSENFKCEKCPFKTVYKYAFRAHVLTHNKSRKLYNCPLCPFQTPNKAVLRNSHHLLHKSDEETRKFHCAHCSFKGKTKHAISRHLLVHKQADAVVLHKCDKCSYQTRHMGCIRKHQQVHKDIQELDVIPCSFCPYQARTKDHLRSHMKRHHEKGPNIECDFCSYQTHFSAAMRRHRLIHMKSEEIKFHYCDKCTYKAKSANEVNQHIKRVHLNPPKEEKWYMCNQCGLQLRRRFLKRHLAFHKGSGQASSADPVKIKKNLFYCYHCSYYTKSKDDLKAHVRMHANDFYHCDKCKFQTRYRSCIYRHKKTQH